MKSREKTGPKRSLLSTIFIAICRPFNSREITIARSSQAEKGEYYKYEQIGSSGMSLLTENFLNGNLLHGLQEKTPDFILKTAMEFHQVSGDPVYRLIEADLCRYFAGKGKAKEAIRFHLAAFRFCCLAFYENWQRKMQDAPWGHDFHFGMEMQIYNESLAGIFRYLKNRKLLFRDKFTLQGPNGAIFAFEKPHFHLSIPVEKIEDFSLCSDYSVKALRLINRHSGIGVPLVARIAAKKSGSALQTPRGLTIPVTFLLRIHVQPDGNLSLTPYYVDTSVQEKISVSENCAGQGEWTLFRDFSTPLACFMNSVNKRNLLSGMLNPIKFDPYTGLYMVEPYHPDKIPVIFIHGLMSGPETWGQMLNSLKYDPQIRKRYQFWFFFYSTGAPILYAAGKLHHALLQTQKEFCTTPEATANFEKMVLVGHSMGGLLTQLLMLQDPYDPIRKITKRSYQEVMEKLSPKQQKAMRAFFDNLSPLPFIRRVVFMATPHRGAAMAKRGLAALGIRLIRLPYRLLVSGKILREVWQVLLPGVRIPWKKRHFFTGLDNLDPDSVFIRWLSESPLRKDIPYHSIIGNKKHSGIPGGSDGVVSYTSSHLEGAASECIVKSEHSVHRAPEAIRELLRILLLHLRETDGAAGSVPRG